MPLPAEPEDEPSEDEEAEEYVLLIEPFEPPCMQKCMQPCMQPCVQAQQPMPSCLERQERRDSVRQKLAWSA